MAHTDWVSGHDAAFFLLEGPTTPYHMGALLRIEGPPVSHQDVLAALGRRLPLVPRFRERLLHAPILHSQAWIQDDHFDLEYHVRRVSLPAPGTEEQLKHLVAELMAEHLNRFRPLWELWTIDGLASGETAALLKAHHAAFDGMTGAHDLALLFDSTPRGGGRRTAEPKAGPAPSEVRFLAQAAGHTVAGPASTATRALRRGLRDPWRMLSTGAATAAGVAEVAVAGLRPAPRNPMNQPIGPNRLFDMVAGSLQDFKEVKDALGGTVNDVVLAAVTGGLRAWLVGRGEPVDGVELRALVPVSLRSGKDAASAGNNVTGILAPLPVYEADPVRRLGIVRDATASAKASYQGFGAGLILDLPGLVPTALARAVASIQRVQRFLNMSLPNIRGPAEPLYLSGRRITEIVPAPPLSANCGLIVGAMSYAGTMDFGLLADPDIVPDLGLVAEGIEKSVQELVHLSGATASLLEPPNHRAGGVS